MPDNRLFVSAGFDCEPLQEMSRCGGPLDWAESEEKVLAIAEIYRSRGMIGACSFNLTPEAAKAQPDLYRSLRDEGFSIGLQPNITAFRHPQYGKDLGEYSCDEQRVIIGQCKADFEDALGFTTTSYLPCCGSRGDCTASILVEHGFKEYNMSGPGRWPRNAPDKITVGLYPFPHKGSALHRCMAGDLDLLVIPNTVDLTGKYRRGNGWAPSDIRGEAEVCEETWAMYREIIDTYIELALDMNAALPVIRPVGHNTRYNRMDNCAYVLDYLPVAARKYGLELVPTDPPRLRVEAVKLGWFDA